MKSTGNYYICDFYVSHFCANNSNIYVIQIINILTLYQLFFNSFKFENEKFMNQDIKIIYQY